MAGNQEYNGWVGPTFLSGLAGLIIWKSLSPKTKEKIWGFLDAVAAEQERRRLAAIAEAQKVLPKFGETPWPDVFGGLPLPFETDVGTEVGTGIVPALMRQLDLQNPLNSTTKVPVIFDPDRKWLDVVIHPSVVVILGRRGGGKSALGFRLLELNRFRSKPYVVGLPESGAKELPDWLGTVPSLDDLPRDSIALIDEAYLTYHARDSMSETNRSVSQLLNLSRQRNQTLIFVTQEARQLDKNITSVADVVVFKKPSALQIELERPELRPIARRAHDAFTTVKGSVASRGYVFSPDSDFEGLLENQLPSFWTPRLSTAFALERRDVDSAHPPQVSRDHKQSRAEELRIAGYSYSAIAKELGVSKSTVVNYLKGYPYKR